jgi:hypothetical protein
MNEYGLSGYIKRPLASRPSVCPILFSLRTSYEVHYRVTTNDLSDYVTLLSKGNSHPKIKITLVFMLTKKSFFAHYNYVLLGLCSYYFFTN